MVREKLPRRRPVPGQMRKAVAVTNDERLLRLAERMRVAEQALHGAMNELAQAEQRLSEALSEKRTSKRPRWYVTALAREAQAGAALEKIYRQIAQVRAHTNAGLSIKLHLAAALYGESLDKTSDETDMVSRLLQSLISDVSNS